jgi:hypothetical protein
MHTVVYTRYIVVVVVSLSLVLCSVSVLILKLVVIQITFNFLLQVLNVGINMLIEFESMSCWDGFLYFNIVWIGIMVYIVVISVVVVSGN